MVETKRLSLDVNTYLNHWLVDNNSLDCCGFCCGLCCRRPGSGYLQADPLGLVDGPSIYGYALQNPQRYVDPRGEAVCGGVCVTGVVVGVGRAAVWAYRAYKLAQAASPAAVGPVAAARERVAAAAENGQCPDPCDEAKIRVDDAKNRANRLKGCKGGDGAALLNQKANAWGELCRARKQRDRLCDPTDLPPGKTPEGEKAATYFACAAYASCMAASAKEMGDYFEGLSK